MAEPEELRGPTRDQLLARVSDVLRRSGVEDAEALIAELEVVLPPVVPLHLAGRRLAGTTGPVLVDHSAIQAALLAARSRLIRAFGD